MLTLTHLLTVFDGLEVVLIASTATERKRAAGLFSGVVEEALEVGSAGAGLHGHVADVHEVWRERGKS